MNLPRQLSPTARTAMAARQYAPAAGAAPAGVVPAGRSCSAVMPSDSVDDLCRSQCSTVGNDSGYNLCVQLCRGTRSR
jgi:hypothetical protein